MIILPVLWIFGNNFRSDWGRFLMLSFPGLGVVIQIIKWNFRRKSPDGVRGDKTSGFLKLFLS
ncbi:MAG: hypothetical protein DRP96_08840 [Candidatus Neomarinimicrobiota bacterium]|nr:MAG: hypothetical protein DRP96_08840 [Candidatus Neomarinimicrobiota bacterium]